MSSDPIEVLRELVQRWRKEESRHEKCDHGVDPAVSNYHEGMSQALGECADELESALAQQPAAVDEALDRLRREGHPRLWHADLVGGQISVDRMREILTAALARQQGGTPE